MDDPNVFLGLDPKAESWLCKEAKDIYDYSLRVIGSNNVGCLGDLLVEGFDNEQIWQQIELYNDCILSHHERLLLFLMKGADNSSKGKIRKRLKTSSSKKKNVTFEPSNDCDMNQSKAKPMLEVSADDGQLDEELSEEEKELEELLKKVTGKNNTDPAADSDSDMEDDLGNSEDEENDNEDDGVDDSSSQGDDDTDLKMKNSSVKSLKNKLMKMNSKQNGVQKKSIVDDKFFKLSEMEAFLDEQDKMAMKTKPDDEDEETDDEDLSDDDAAVQTNYTYKDFFDMPNDNNGGSAEDDTDEDGEENDETGSEEGETESESEEMAQKDEVNITEEETAVSIKEKSSFEKRQEKLQRQITDLEKRNLDPKSWQMTGEVFSSARPENSLLQETVEFDYMTRQAPAITEETTKTIEELIIQRIKDKAWDDVERKARATDKMVEYSKRVVVDQEKSKMTLSEIYEQQYIKLSEKSDETVTKQDPKHAEVRASMNALFMKLDALANFHYTPKPMVQDVKIISNLPALTVEEKLPSAVSDAALRAPEEVQAKSKREFVGETERTKTDKLRARRLKKKLQHEKRLKREKKEKQNGKIEKPNGDAKQADNKVKKMKLGAVLNERLKSPKSKPKVQSA